MYHVYQLNCQQTTQGSNSLLNSGIYRKEKRQQVDRRV